MSRSYPVPARPASGCRLPEPGQPRVHGAGRALIIGDGDVAQLGNPALRLTRARYGLCHCQRGIQGRAARADYQDAEGQLTVRYVYFNWNPGACADVRKPSAGIS